MGITKHAEDRIRQRCGIPKRVVQKNAETALRHGIKHGECSGRLKKYFDYLFLSHNNTGANIRIYGNHVYIFTKERLVTVLPLPHEHKNAVRKLMNKKETAGKLPV
jgi:hypothetical protein